MNLDPLNTGANYRKLLPAEQGHANLHFHAARPGLALCAVGYKILLHHAPNSPKLTLDLSTLRECQVQFEGHLQIFFS